MTAISGVRSHFFKSPTVIRYESAYGFDDLMIGG